MVAYSFGAVTNNASETNDNLISVPVGLGAGINPSYFVVVETALSTGSQPGGITFTHSNGNEVLDVIWGVSQRAGVYRISLYRLTVLGTDVPAGTITAELGYTSTRKCISAVEFVQGDFIDDDPVTRFTTGYTEVHDSDSNTGANGGQFVPKEYIVPNCGPGLHLAVFGFAGTADAPLPAGWVEISKISTPSSSVRRGHLFAYRHHRETDLCVTKYKTDVTQQWAMVSALFGYELPAQLPSTLNGLTGGPPVPAVGASVIIGGNKVTPSKYYIVLNGNRYPLDIT